MAKAQRLRDVAEANGVDLPAAAIQFCLAHPAVVSVALGARTPAEIEQCVAWYNAVLPTAFWQELQAGGLIGDDSPIPRLA
jgi:D-threo-aldose 1-dehydrogenase